MWLFDEEFETAINMKMVRSIYIEEIGNRYAVVVEFSERDKYPMRSFTKEKDAVEYLKELIADLN